MMSKKEFDIVSSLRLMSPTEIYPYDGNVKIHTQEQIEALAGIIARDGFDKPVVVDKDHVIIAGHGRRLAALHLNLPKIPVLVRDDMTPKQVKAARLSDNQVSVGEFDMEALNRELKEILKMDGEMEITLEDMAFDPGSFELDLGPDVMIPTTPTENFQPQDPPQPERESRDLSKPDLSKELTYKPLRQVIVDCPTEDDQERVYTMAVEAGYVARPLTV